MKLFNIACVFAVLLLAKTSQAQSVEIFDEQSKFGMRLSNGQVLLPAVYDDIYQCNSDFGLWYVMKGNLFAIYNAKGEALSDFRYTSVSCYNSHIVVGINDKYGILDKYGKPLTPIIFDDIDDFEFCTGAYDNEDSFCKEALAVVKKGERFGAYDVNGKEVIPATMDMIVRQYKLYMVKSNGKTGWMNSSGKWVIPAQYDEAYYFVDGYALVAQDRQKVDPQDPSLIYTEQKWGMINESGRVLIPLEYESLNRPNAEGLMVVQKNGRYGVIDTLNKVYLPLEFEYLSLFDYQLAPHVALNAFAEVKIEGLTAWIDHKGKVVLPPKYEYVNTLGDKLVVTNGNLSGLINVEGTEILPLAFYSIEDFILADRSYYKVARMTGDEYYKYGLFTVDGKESLPTVYDNIQNFYYQDSLLRVKKDNKEAMMNSDFQLLTGFDYDFMDSYSNFGFINVEQKEKYGLLDLKGKSIVPCKFEKVTVRSEEAYGDATSELFFFILVQKNNKWMYYGPKGKLIPAAQTRVY